ncbi:MAG: nucleoside monophosphate kinase [Candidatus Andersenbacteria bacterium]|nr:nucleoside monophosphate kinase [bacterium]MDZ4225621.1 nucleoside monophosphate kinase [Candidatus Andersenbacteria bacterium]
MLPKIIYIMGAPGAGKGTQAKMLAEKIGYHQFSTGDAFREVARQNTDLGHRVKETIDNGYLAPPEMAAEIVMTAVKEHIESGRGLVFDGTPRTVAEAKIVDLFFAEENYGKPLVIYLAVDRAEMIERNSKRKFCLGVSGDFPVVNDDDRRRCEERRGMIGVRPDDEPGKFATRWDQFMTLTYPVVEEYRRRGELHELDGMPSVAEVFKSVMKVIDKVQN